MTLLGAMKDIFPIVLSGLCLFFFLFDPGEASSQLLGPDPLFDAAERANYADAQKALLAGSSPNVQGKKKVTALMAAARAGAVELVKLLLEFKAIPDLADSEGNTALMYSEVGNTPAKLIKEFRKKSEKLQN